jgi:hypothetical protein
VTAPTAIPARLDRHRPAVPNSDPTGSDT